jgi:hypothetical protein
MRLSDGQKQTIEALSKILPLEVLLKIKEGKIREFEDLHLNLFDPGSNEEKMEMEEIIDREISERRRRINKILHFKC